MGRNGSGKSTLLAHLAGLRAPAAGTVTVGGASRHRLPPRRLIALGRTGAPGCRPPALRRLGRRRVPPPPTGTTGCRRRHHGRHARRRPARIPRPASPRPVRGPAAGPGPGRRARPEPAGAAAGRADPRPRLRGQGAAGRPCCGSWPPRATAVVLATHDVELVAQVGRPRRWCSPRARWWPTGRPATSCATRRSSPPRWPRSWPPTPWLTVDEVARSSEEPARCDAGNRRRRPGRSTATRGPRPSWP